MNALPFDQADEDSHNLPPDEPEITLRQLPGERDTSMKAVSPEREPATTHASKQTQPAAKKRASKSKEKASSQAKRNEEDTWSLYKNTPIAGDMFSDTKKERKTRAKPDTTAIMTSKTKAEHVQQKAAQPKKEEWQLQKDALREKLNGETWNPRKRLSPDALDGIRAMHAQYPSHFTSLVLAQHFKVSPEAIRRILKSKWRPNTAEEEDRKARWDRRGERIWGDLVEKGVHAPKKWRDMGIGRGPRKRPTILFPTPQDRKKGKNDSDSGIEAANSAWLESLSQRVV